MDNNNITIIIYLLQLGCNPVAVNTSKYVVKRVDPDSMQIGMTANIALPAVTRNFMLDVVGFVG